MIPTITNSLFTLLSFTAIFGVFIHDTQIYSMTVAANTPKTEAVVNAVASVELLRAPQHVHPAVGVLTGSVAQQTAIQPKNENDKKYISQRRGMSNDFDNGYNWPSI